MNKTLNKEKITGIAVTALFAALLCAVSPFSIPIPFGDVPLSLATLVIYLASAVLGPTRAVAAVAVYIAIGCLGLPVFSGFAAGPGRILGPTGGYLAGYIPLALISGFAKNLRLSPPVRIAAASAVMLTATAALYFFGTAWYCIYADVPIFAALTACVFPFIPGDAAKIVVAALISDRVRAMSPIGAVKAQ